MNVFQAYGKQDACCRSSTRRMTPSGRSRPGEQLRLLGHADDGHPVERGTIAIVAGLGGWMTIAGYGHGWNVIASFISYSGRFAEPLRMLGDLYNQVQDGGGRRGAYLCDHRPSAPDQTDEPGAVEGTWGAWRATWPSTTSTFSYVPGKSPC